jgi:type I restriction enzyme S subunit
MNVEKRHLDLIQDILLKYVPKIEVRAFGSRVKGTNRSHSDLDLALVSSQKMDLKRISILKEAFDASDLPYCVDVLDYNRVDKTFRAIIDAQYVVIQKRA